MIRSRYADALAGLLAAGLALGVAELMAGITGASSLVVAVGNVVVDYTPGSVVKAAIEAFGTNDKLVLLLSIVLISLALGAVLGAIARRRRYVAPVAFAGFGLAGALAGVRDPLSSDVLSFVNAAVAAIVGWWAFGRLLGAATFATAPGHEDPAVVVPGRRLVDRRRFLTFAAAVVGSTALTAVTGRLILGPAVDIEAQRAAIALPSVPAPPPAASDAENEEDAAAAEDAEETTTGAEDDERDESSPLTAAADQAAEDDADAESSPPAAAVVGATGDDAGNEADDAAQEDGAEPPPRTEPTRPTVTQTSTAIATLDIPVPGQSSLITPNSEFYRIDTALTVPRVDVEGWTLRIKGMVDEPYELDFEELLEMVAIEQSATLACVSNQVGGSLVGNAIWLGVSLPALLKRAGAHDDATQIVGRSVDDFTVGFPTEVALDGRPAMVAIGMNGEPLPAEHGFPARLIVPGLYGYVSATKWLREIEVTTLEAFDAYWIRRGWSKVAPIKTQSRIDVPRGGRTVAAGRLPIAGVAWGGIRSIDRVEVRIASSDGQEGEWQDAQLGKRLTRSSWRQWALEWDATPGTYDIEVRATDGNGDTQTAEKHEPAPNGATGYHQIRVDVEDA